MDTADILRLIGLAFIFVLLVVWWVVLWNFVGWINTKFGFDMPTWVRVVTTIILQGMSSTGYKKSKN